MSRKIKGSALDSKARTEDDKARLRHQSLLQDYVDLQKEVNGMRSQLDAAKQRKLVLAAEVRFLRRRRRCLVEAKTMHLTQEPPLGHALTLQHQTKSMKKRQPVVRKEASKRSLPLDAVANPKKKQKFSQQVPSYLAPQESNRAHKRTSNGAKEAGRHSLTQSYLPMSDLNQRVMRRNTLDLNQKQKTSGAKGATMRNPDVAFDLNKDGTHPGIREPSLRAPIFDLNEISTGDEDFYINVDANEFEESTKGVLKGLNDEQPSDLKLSSICRNSGEGTSRVGKRKISWQDPVALRV